MNFQTWSHNIRACPGRLSENASEARKIIGFIGKGGRKGEKREKKRKKGRRKKEKREKERRGRNKSLKIRPPELNIGSR